MSCSDCFVILNEAKDLPNERKMNCTEFIHTVEALLGPLTGEQKEQYRLLDGLYRDWNNRINVISRKDIDGLYLHHVLHSLAIAGYMKRHLPEDFARATTTPPADCDTGQPFRPESHDCHPERSEGSATPLRILDLGTGGGFPGIPLAIFFPGAEFTLCDSIGKKTKVAEAVAEAIGLTNVTVINSRAEDIDGQFDYIVSRAVTSLDRFLPWVRGKYDKGILYLKGGDIVEEISTAMGRFRIPGSAIHTWRIDSWIQDPYFAEKSVIFIGHQIRNNH